MFEHVQELVKKQTKRRPPKAGNGEKNMFTGLLFCADCGSKMWYHVRHNKETTYFFSCSNYKGDRGTCESTHYIRADSVEMIVRAELEKKILELNQQLTRISEVRDGKEHFLSCVRSFAEMKEVTPMILQELIEKIEVHAVEGTGLNRTQSVIIHYKFIGELDMPENFDKIKVNTRKGVEVEYLRTTKTA